MVYNLVNKYYGAEVMGVYLKDVEEDFDRRELLYLELVDCFGVLGVHRRLGELRTALENNESEVIIKSKRRFLTGASEWVYRPVAKTSMFSWSSLTISKLPVEI